MFVLKNKILYILHLPTPVHGAAIVGAQIKGSKHINTVFDCRYINLGLSKEIDTIGKQGLKKIWVYLTMLARVFKQLLRFRPDIYYITPTAKGIGLYKDIPVILLAKCFKTQVVYHFHNKGVSQKQHNVFDHLLYKWMFKKAKVILLSKNLYFDIKKYVSPNQVYYCPNGIADDTLNHNIKLKASEKQKNVELLFLSNLIETKGVQVLLKACQKLKEGGVAFQCNFIGGVGDISVDEFNTRVAQLNLSSHVAYLGKKYDQEKADIFQNADIFVHPTFNDCVPLVILEAMQNSLPIVSTFEGGITDLVEDSVTGFLVPKHDVLELSEKLKQLISSATLRKRMGQAGRKKYEQEFTVDIFEKQFTDILNKILNEDG